jgi:hypothetical protein
MVNQRVLFWYGLVPDSCLDYLSQKVYDLRVRQLSRPSLPDLNAVKQILSMCRKCIENLSELGSKRQRCLREMEKRTSAIDQLSFDCIPKPC